MIRLLKHKIYEWWYGTEEEEDPPQTIHVPRPWGIRELGSEILSWGAPKRYLSDADIKRFRRIVSRIWEADATGMSKNRISSILGQRTPDQVIKVGLIELDKELDFQKKFHDNLNNRNKTI